MNQFTTLSVTREQKERFERIMPDQWRSQGTFLTHLMDYYEGESAASSARRE